MSSAMKELKERYGVVADLKAAISLLNWDQQTNMPPKGAEMRGRQIATLATLQHEKLLDDKISELLAQADAHAAGDDKTYVEELRYSRERQSKIPTQMIEEQAMTDTAAFEAWHEARTKQDFSIFAPWLEKVVAIRRRMADLYGYKDHPWDALVEDFDRGMTSARIKELFTPLREGTVALLRKIQASPSQPDVAFLNQSWDVQRQWDFGMKVLEDIGFDLKAGRQDRSAHPFTSSSSPVDVRLTTRLREDDLLGALGSTIHEAGHGLYEQGFRLDDARTPLADAPSLGIHESQSRLWEIRIGQSRPFWAHYLPILKSYFPGMLDGVDLDKMYAAVNRVQPSLIRVEADEVTYNLHIILRFEMELALIEGSLKVKDVPEVWNAKMKESLGVTVPNDAKGCLQDIHWSQGGIGYFPSYSLGNIYSAMLMEKIERDIPTLWQQVESGQFAELLEWLRANIHRPGCRLRANDLVERATGRQISVQPLLSYLNAKYGALYGF